MRLYNRQKELVNLIESANNRVVKSTVSGMSYFDFSISVHSPSYNHLELEGYIQLDDGVWFTIKEIVSHGTNCEVKCILNVEEIIGTTFNNFVSKDNTISQAILMALSGTPWRIENKVSNPTITRNVYGNNMNSWDIIQRICTIYDKEVSFDTDTQVVTIQDRVGEDKGVYFMSDLNLKALKHDSHSHKFITRLKPIGKDGLTISDVNGGSPYVTNYLYSNKVITAVWEQTRYEKAEDLKVDAQKYLDSLAVPYESFEVDIIDLANSSIGGHTHLTYNIGDIVTIKDKEQQKTIEHRIIQIEKYLDDPTSNRCNIANKEMSFEDYYKRLQLIADSLANTVNEDGSINPDKVPEGSGGGGGSIPPDGLPPITGDMIVDGAITATHIKAESIQAEHIVADAITSNHIKANSIDTEHLMSDIITSQHIQAGTVIAGSGIIADGAIGSAQISSLDASKLTAGTIDTSDITIAGANSNLRIKGNRLQVFDGIGTGQVERVSLGDVEGDGTVYGLRVRGADGQTILLDENGVTSQGITDGSITNDKINPDANIDGGKLNIDSVINTINTDGSSTINSTRIDVDAKSLSTVIQEINTKNTEQSNNIATNTSSITANANAIKLKVDTQTYTADKNANTTKFNKLTSDVSVLQNEVSLKVGQTEIDTAIKGVDAKITATNSQVSSIKADLAGVTTNVSNVQTTTNTLQTQMGNVLDKSMNLYIYKNVAPPWSSSTTPEGEMWLCGYGSTGSPANVGGYFYDISTGSKINVPATYINPNSVMPFNQEIYIAYSSKLLATWYDSASGGWKYCYLNSDGTLGTVGALSHNDSRNFLGYFVMSEAELVASAVLFESARNYREATGQSTEYTVRMASAESKITEDAITNTVKKSFYTKTETEGAITSKGYQTASQVQQTVDNFKLEFQESGGYNLLYNGDFTRNFEHWNVTSGFTSSISNSVSAPRGIGLRLNGQLGVSGYVTQYVTDTKTLAIRNFTTSSYVFVSSSGTDGATPLVRVYSRLKYSDGTIEYKYALAKINTTNKWERVSVSFSRDTSKTLVEIGFSLSVGDTTRYAMISQAMIEEGSVLSNWSPNPNETFAGVTTIDKNGVTVDCSNVDTKATMSADGFKVISTSNNKELFNASNGNLTLEGVLKTGTTGQRIEVSDSNYKVYDGTVDKAFFGFKNIDGYYTAPKFYMGADGIASTKPYFSITHYKSTENPQGYAGGYVDLAHRVPSRDDWSNLKMYDNGDVRVAPVRDFVITTNYLNGAYENSTEKLLATFTTSNSSYFNSNLEIGCVRNQTNTYGLILADDSKGSTVCRVRVQVDDSGLKFFRPVTTAGDIDNGSPSYPWKGMYSKTAFTSRGVVLNEATPLPMVEGGSILDRISFSTQTMDNTLRMDVTNIQDTGIVEVSEEGEAYVDQTELLKIALQEIKSLKAEIALLKTTK